MDYQGPERRADNNSLELQKTILKLVSKVESMEETVNLKLENVKDKITHIEDKLLNHIGLVNKKLDTHIEYDCNDDLELKIEEHQTKIAKAEIYVGKIHDLELRYKRLEDKAKILEDEITKIKNAPKEMVFDFFKKVGIKILWALVGILGLAIIFALSSPKFWELIK